MKSIILTLLAAFFISPFCNGQKLWRQTHYSTYDLSNPNLPIPVDSTVYFYNPYSASLPTWNPLKRLMYDPYVEHFKCDSFVRYQYSFSSQPWIKHKVEIQSFDTKGNVTSRIKKEARKFKAEPENQEGDQYTYNASGNVETFVRLSWANNQWNNLFRENYFYTGGTLTSTQADTFKSGQWESNWKRDYAYTNGKLSEEIFYKWAVSNWSNTSRILYEYDAAGRLAEKTLQTWDVPNATWNDVRRDAYTYDNSGNCIADTAQSWQASSLTWRNIELRIYEYNIDNKPIRLTSKSWQSAYPPFGWVNARKHEYTYNADGLISHDESLYWEYWMNSWEYNQNSRGWNYYYEQFTVRVNDIAQAENNLTLYPNPAITQLRINVTWQNAQPFTVAILDMSGRVLKQWSEAATKSYSSAIPVMDMPAGSYTIVLNNGEQKISKRFSVLK